MALSSAERELIALGISVAVGCKPCTSHHLAAAREAGVTLEDTREAVDVALSVRRRSTRLMERYFLTRLGQRQRADAGHPPAQRRDRLGGLVSIGTAYAVNCTSSLRQHRAAVAALGVPQSDVEAVLELARTIKGKGAYHVERYSPASSDERIFLFLDLTGSSRLAERLGHARYSRLIRSCYHDLTSLVIRFQAEIYQYVGDEVVLSWSLSEGLTNANCVRIYFAFREKLMERQDDYIAEFGVAPSFRGAMDMGPVTRADLGGVSPEEAYHGDVLNTAARILEIAKETRHDLVISGRVKDALPAQPDLAATFVTEVVPRGKKDTVRVFALDVSTSGSPSSETVSP
jgi:AhpD family alkylhydroperoxidase